MADLLTSAEHEAMAVSVTLANQVAAIIGDGPAAYGDLAEAVHHIHAVQRMILAQASARVYPDRYRLLGGGLPAQLEPQGLNEAVRAYRERKGL